MRLALDSNVLVYAFETDQVRSPVARRIIEAAPSLDVIFPVQVFGEFLNVVRRKYPARLESARAAVATWSLLNLCVSTRLEYLTTASRLAEERQLQFWDCVILTGSSAAGANFLLTEDMQDGATIGGVTLVDPFNPANRDLLDALLRSPPGTA